MLIVSLIIVTTTELLFIFLLSKQIVKLLYTLFYLPLKHLPRRLASLSRSGQAGHNISNHITALLFFPGTAIHEFSHAMVALLLRVKVGQIMLYPHKDKETGELKAGSVEVGKVDPVRLAIIGIAPSLIGLGIITLIVHYLFDFKLPLDNILSSYSIFSNSTNYLFFLALFMVSTTMFTSKRDLKEFLIVTPVFALISFALYYFGFRISLSQGLVLSIEHILKILAFVLGFTLIVDLLIYVFLFVPINLLLSIIGRIK